MARAASRSYPTLEGLAPTALCVLAALVPLAFAARLFEPYVTIKEALVQAAIHHAPARLEGYAIFGRLHLERGEYERALTALGRAMRLGYDTEVFDWKATALERTRQHTAAVATLNELAWLRPVLQWPRQRLFALSSEDKNHREDKQ